MMRAAIIPTYQSAKLVVTLTDYHLILAQEILNSAKYRDAYKDPEIGYKILDNGAFEGQLVSTQELFRMAQLLNVDEIVVPDTLHDWASTIEQAIHFTGWAQAFPQFRYMGVAQGESVEEVLGCACELANMAWVDVIGLPKHLESLGQTTRIILIEKFMASEQLRYLPVHLLGGTSWAEEPAIAKFYDNVRGIDTSFPVYMGMQGKLIDEAPYEERPRDYFGNPKYDSFAIQRNVGTYLKWCYSETS